MRRFAGLVRRSDDAIFPGTEPTPGEKHIGETHMSQRSLKWLTIFTILLTAGALFSLLHGQPAHGAAASEPAAAVSHAR